MLLKLRTPIDGTQSSRATRSFERVCVEYYIYHSAIIMLFDPDINPATSVEHMLDKFQSCLNPHENDLVVVRSPVLGSLPQIYITIIKLTGLTREAEAPIQSRLSNVRSEYTDLVKWQRRLDEEGDGKAVMRGGKLYEIATRLLLIFAYAHTDALQVSEYEAEVTDTASEGLQQLLIQPLGRVFGKYWLWPLAILGSVMTRTRDINLIRDKMDAIAHRSNCNAIKIVRYLLESIWANNSNSGTKSFSLSCLATLLDGEIMQKTSSLLLSYRDHERHKSFFNRIQSEFLVPTILLLNEVFQVLGYFSDSIVRRGNRVAQHFPAWHHAGPNFAPHILIFQVEAVIMWESIPHFSTSSMNLYPQYSRRLVLGLRRRSPRVIPAIRHDGIDD